MQASAPAYPAPELTADRKALRRWPRAAVLVHRWQGLGSGPATRWFLRLDASLPLAVGAGGQLYEEDELAGAGQGRLPLLALEELGLG